MQTHNHSETFASFAREYRNLEKRAEKNSRVKDADNWRQAAERYEAKAKAERERVNKGRN